MYPNSCDPLISIIVPIYKVEKYLIKCIESIKNQSYRNLEIILVDNGSPDNCGSICDDYALIDVRIKVFHFKKNIGLSGARNFGLDIITGEYLTFIDSDDFVKIDYIETLYELVRIYKVPLSVSGFIHYHEERGEEKLNNIRISDGILTASEAVETMFYQDKFETSTWGKLYRKELFGNDIRYPKELLYEDLPTTYKLILRAGKIAYTNKRTYYYVLRKDSILYSKFNYSKLDILKVGDLMLNDFQNNNDLFISLKCRLFSAYLSVFFQTESGNEYEEILWKRIVNYRWTVLSSVKTRRKAKLAAFMSFFGKSVIRYCFSFNNNRN